ncbi:MAG: hypothetical protein ACQES2_02275 [Pseudomonadota bacterium]
MQLETRKDLEYIAEIPACDFRYAAIVDEQGRESEITHEMIDQLYDRLCAEHSIRRALEKAS